MNYKGIKSWTDAHNVHLVAVSKKHTIDEVMQVYKQGHRDFGENRVQELLEKEKTLPDDIRWHQIGPLQTNKIKSIVPFIHLVHSVDRVKVLKYINKEARKVNRIIPVLIQIHIAEESTKHGFSYTEADELFQQNLKEKYPYIKLRGLMGMATFTDDEKQVAREFGQLKSYFDKLTLKYPKWYDLDLLSMGMSGDYKIAVASGSNMIRVGTLIFGERKY